MKKTMKQIGAALLAAFMVVTAAGCSSGGNTAESTQAEGGKDSSAGAEIAMIADDDVIIGLSQEISYKEAVSMI